MRIALDRSSDAPLYEQVAGFIRERCRSGAFEPGSRLPSARALAEELGVSRITTEGAYAQLEAEALVVRRLGSGTFVAEGAARSGEARGWPVPAWQAELASRGPVSGLEAGAGFRARPRDDVIDLASGLGDPAFLPREGLRSALRRACVEEESFDYADPRGYAPFREAAARVLSSRGIDAAPGEILVTSGSQEGILLFALLAARRGGPVLVESPTYAVALALFRALGLGVVGVPVDARGMRVDLAERALRETKPAFIYTMPNFQNPSGASLAPERRAELAALAAREGVPVLEDDYVGDLRVEGRDLPALCSIAPPGTVAYSGTFSKMLAPGLRVGFLLARGPVFDLLLDLKYAASLSSPGLEQRALARIVTVGGYDNHVRRSRRACRSRRDALLEALEALPPGFALERPAGGLFAWLRLPPGLGARRLAEACRAVGVLVYPGGPCFPDPADPEADRYLRLNFAAEREERLVEGARRIAAAAVDLGAGRALSSRR